MWHKLTHVEKIHRNSVLVRRRIKNKYSVNQSCPLLRYFSTASCKIAGTEMKIAAEKRSRRSDSNKSPDYCFPYM